MRYIAHAHVSLCRLSEASTLLLSLAVQSTVQGAGFVLFFVSKKLALLEYPTLIANELVH